MSINYHVVTGENLDSVVAFFPDKAEPIKVADSNHPYWTDIRLALQRGDESVYDLFDVRKGVGAKLRALSDRVDFDGENVYFDGSVVNDALAQQVVRFLEQGVSDWEPLVKFWEKIATNPNEHSRDNLYRWLQTHGFSITLDGDLVAYKGVKVGQDSEGNDQFQSKHAGPAFVDGVHVNGYVPNVPGTIVTMPRADVQHDPTQGCHRGLHVGTWEYASSFGDGVTLEVHVNPRDVVSVPTDSGDAKMRVCRYTVVKAVEGYHASAVVLPEEDYYDDGWQGDVGYKAY